MLNTPAGILKRYRETQDSTEATILAGQILELIAKLEASQKPEEPFFILNRQTGKAELFFPKPSLWQRIKNWLKGERIATMYYGLTPNTTDDENN